MQRIWRICLVIGFCTTLLISPPAFANGMPVSVQTSPSALFVPNKDTKVEIVSEELTFDFRNAAYNDNIYGPWVTARYRLHNTSQEADTLTVAFLYLDEVNDLQATWKGKPLRATPSEQSFPANWTKPPEFQSSLFETHWLEPQTGAVYQIGQADPKGAHATLLPIELQGQETDELVVTFRQNTTGCDQCDTNRPYLHYTYLLSPARQWADFKNLHIKVIAPPRYDMATEPSLSYSGELEGHPLYEGTFETLPAGDLHLSLRKQPDSPFIWWSLGGGAFALMAALAFLYNRTKNAST